MALAKAVSTKQPKATPQRVSINPDTATQGLIDDIDVTITDALTCEWDYNGQQPAGPAMAVELTDPNGAAHTQYYSAGKAEDWQAEDSGEGFLAVSGKSGINEQSNFMKFMSSLVECGFPKELLDEGNVKVIVGTKCHINQIAQERRGLVRQGKNADRPSSTLLVTKIHSLPGAEGKGAAKGAGKAAAAVGGKANGAAKGSAKPDADTEANDLDSTIATAIMEALSNADGNELPKKAVAQIIFKAFSAPELSKQRNAAIKRSADADFLKNVLPESGITFDGSTLSLG